MKTINELDAVRAYYQRIEAQAKGPRGGVISVREGRYYRDTATIRIDEGGEVKAPKGLEPTEAEALAIKAEVSGADVAKISPTFTLEGLQEGDLFPFYGMDGRILMVQERREIDGEKHYVPWTHWGDNVWRMTEPDPPLPLYNLPALKEHHTVFIHEGPKSVRNLLAMLDEGKHPWQKELESAAHVGWIGGALNPYRTDWGALGRAGVTTAYIVADNDEPGREAIVRIARELSCVTRWIRFPHDWPPGFDLGDMVEGEWPPFKTCVQPATFLTQEVEREGEGGRKAYEIRPWAKNEWTYIEDGHFYVHVAEPSKLVSADQFNTIVQPYSHVDNTRRLVDRARTDRATSAAYNPGKPSGPIYDGGPVFNTHVGSSIKSAEGDISPFEEYMAGLIPEPDEREFVCDWVATLIAKPEVRMGIALLMIGGFGVGKTTLGQDILAPLLGKHNVAYPSDKDILGDFNEWLAHRRLAIVNEIHAGKGVKIYEQLKTVITDERITVNRKYFRQYETDNWCHIYACSNHEDGLFMQPGDRRWYMPRLGPKDWWGKAEWTRFHAWLRSGGLRIIKAWAERRVRGRSITAGDHAPLTDTKAEIVGLTESEEIKVARSVADALRDNAGRASLDLMTLKAWLRRATRSHYMPNDKEIIRAVEDQGCFSLRNADRVKFKKQHARTFANQALLDALEGVEDAEARKRVIREARVSDIGRLLEDEGPF